MLRMSVFLFLLMMLAAPLALAQTNGDDPPADFKSDGCTLFPDGNYRDCCVAHDKDYYGGGSCRERRESDDRLYRCVKGKKGWQNKILARVMWVGVRIGGVSFLPTPFRWGFGKTKKKKEKRKMQVFNKPPADKVEDTETKNPKGNPENPKDTDKKPAKPEPPIEDHSSINESKTAESPKDPKQ